MGHLRKRVSVERLAIEQLTRMLNAGSSRVFNCQKLHKHVVAEGGAPGQFLFKTDDLNQAIFMKEPYPDPEMLESAANPVGTKIFFAYNEKTALEGGRSIFIKDPGLRSALQFHAGLAASDTEAATKDLKILSILDDLPSLDPFLLRDRMTAEGIDPHPGYFDITENEFGRIRDYVMKQFRPMIEVAYKGLDDASALVHLRTLVRKLWDGDDMQALAPIVKAMKLKESEAPEIFAAWKGIIYYDFLFASRQETWKDYANWLNNETRPLDVVPKQIQQTLDQNIIQLRRRYQARWKTVHVVLFNYRQAYDELFVDHKSPEPFIKFLGEARKNFFSLGDSISRVDHAIELWRNSLGSSVLRNLRFEPLHHLVNLSLRVLD